MASNHFVQYVLLFCIVHQVPQRPRNTAANVRFSLGPSAAVQKTLGKCLSLSNPSQKREQPNNKKKQSDGSNESRVNKVHLFFFTYGTSRLIVSKFTVHEGLYSFESNTGKKQAKKNKTE